MRTRTCQRARTRACTRARTRACTRMRACTHARLHSRATPPQVAEIRGALQEFGVRVRTHGSRDDARRQSSASDLLSYLRLVVAPTDDGALLTALALPTRGFPAGGTAVKYLKQAASQRGGVGGMLAAAQ